MPRDNSLFPIVTFDGVDINSTTVSTNATTGALVVVGGVGVGGDLNVAGTITGGSIIYASTSTGTLDVTNTPGTTFTVQSTEQATSTTTGCAVFDGGVGIAGNLHVGGDVVAGAITYASTSTGTLTVTNSPGTTVNIDSTEDSVSQVTGSLVSLGGIGVGGSIHSEKLIAHSTEQSTSTTTGSIVASGGIGMAGNCNIGGSVTTANLNVIGNTTSGGFDFILGNTDQVTRGDSGLSRAVVKDVGNVLAINYNSDFGGGTRIDGALATDSFDVSGDSVFSGITVTGSSILSGLTVSGSSLISGLTVSGSSLLSGLTVTGSSILSGLTVSGTSGLSVLTVSGTSTFTGLAAFGSSTFTGLTVSGTSTFNAITATGNSTFTGVTMNAASVAASGFTVSGVTGSSALTVTGAVGYSALTLDFGATTVFEVNEGSTTVNNVTVENDINVVNEYKINNTTVISNPGGNPSVSATSVTGTSQMDTPLLKIDGNDSLSYSGGLQIGDNINPVSILGPGAGFGGFDFKLGYTDQVTRGDSGDSRAMVKAAGPELIINFANDFSNGTKIDSTVNVIGDININDKVIFKKPLGDLLELNQPGNFADGLKIWGNTEIQGINGLVINSSVHVGGAVRFGTIASNRVGISDRSDGGADWTLRLNRDGDYSNGTEIEGDVAIKGALDVTGDVVSANITAPVPITYSISTSVGVPTSITTLQGGIHESNGLMYLTFEVTFNTLISIGGQSVELSFSSNTELPMRNDRVGGNCTIYQAGFWVWKTMFLEYTGGTNPWNYRITNDNSFTSNALTHMDGIFQFIKQ